VFFIFFWGEKTLKKGIVKEGRGGNAFIKPAKISLLCTYIYDLDYYNINIIYFFY